jgi:hypothetical protein
MRWTSAHFISQDNFTSSTKKIRNGFVNDNACTMLGWIDWRNIAIALINPSGEGALSVIAWLQHLTSGLSV